MGLFDFASKLFGNKYDKDLKDIEPVIDQIKAAYPAIKSLSNDELRQKPADFKSQSIINCSRKIPSKNSIKPVYQITSLDEKEAVEIIP